MPEGVTILEALADGFAYPHGYRFGRCGSCKSRLVSGEVDPLAFTAGQYARLTFPGAPTRDYTMASGPAEREFEFHIRRVPGGAATQRIHALLKLGDPVLVEGHSALPTCARSDRDLYLVDHFEGLTQRHPNLTFTPVFSDTPLGAGWRTSFVTDAVAKDLHADVFFTPGEASARR